MKLIDEMARDYSDSFNYQDRSGMDCERAYRAGFIKAREMALKVIAEYSDESCEVTDGRGIYSVIARLGEEIPPASSPRGI